jgi:hypothetical protein
VLISSDNNGHYGSYDGNFKSSVFCELVANYVLNLQACVKVPEIEIRRVICVNFERQQRALLWL